MEAATLPRAGRRAVEIARRRSPVDWAREHSRAFWIVVGLTALAAALRFATLGVQSYHHDEVVTASRVLRAGFGHAMHAVWFSESTPPVYYALAWVWTQLVGTGEFGLRSISAVSGAPMLMLTAVAWSSVAAHSIPARIAESSQNSVSQTLPISNLAPGATPR